MKKDIYNFRSYKVYLRSLVGEPGTRHGIRSKIAKALGCQPTFISQVFNRESHLSLEQADLLSTYLDHSDEEKEYFMLLIQKERAGTRSLQDYFRRQLDEKLNRRLVLTDRLKMKDALSPEEQAQYYSSWIYAAVHIALTIPELRSRDKLALQFGLTKKKTDEVLEFLIGCGIIGSKADNYALQKTRIALRSDSPNISKHHSNWRQRAIVSLDHDQTDDLHYTAVFSLSREDARQIRDQVLELLNEQRKLVADSKEEILIGYCFDIFGM